MRRRVSSDLQPGQHRPAGTSVLSEERQRVGHAAQVERGDQRQADDQLDALRQVGTSASPRPLYSVSAPGHDLGFGFRRIEGRQFQLAHQPDQRDHEPDRLGQEQPVARRRSR